MEGRLKVDVKFMARLGEILGKREDTVRLPMEASIRDLLSLLTRKYGVRFAEYVFEGGRVRPHILVMVDQETVPLKDVLDRPLRDISMVMFLPPLGGG